MTGTSYVPLWCKSHFSFLEGTDDPAELVRHAARLGLPAIALTDRDGLYGIPFAWEAARTYGLRLLCGAQVTLAGSPLVLLAPNLTGWKALATLLTAAHSRAPKGQARYRWSDLERWGGELLALWPGPPGPDTDAAARIGDRLRGIFHDRLYALVARHLTWEHAARERWLRAWATDARVPLVAGLEVRYARPTRQALHDVLRATAHGRPVAELGRALAANATHAFLAPHAFTARYRDLPDAVARTHELAERCRFDPGELRYRYPGASAGWQELVRRVEAGAREHYGPRVPEHVWAQLRHELTLVRELEVAGYFLSIHEIVRYCRRRGILCQGRGSAANSAICYVLGITAVDPIRQGLLFERFLSRERAEPPDIDLDIQHDRREEVLRHVQRHYGERAAMVANVVRFRSRSAIRAVGAALGFPAEVVDRLVRVVAARDRIAEQDLRNADLAPDRKRIRWWRRLANALIGTPRHLSIHPGGFLLGEDPVHHLVPVEPARMPGRRVIQWDKEGVETLGLFKVDLLALGALTQLQEAFRLLRRHKGLHLELATIPPEDPATLAMVARGDTVGVFQLESRAQMAMLPRLRPRRFYDLVVAISIVRPGPITGGMVHPYLRRRHGEEPVRYPHPDLEPILAKTLGVPLFQEQVMRIAMVAADYTPGEADQLRRDMAAWRRRGNMAAHRERIVSRMVAKGIDRAFSERIFAQIEGFGEYGFPESHAASFAILAYATAWLKRHHPEVFFCALLNAQPMGFYTPATLVAAARRAGVEVRPIHVNHSLWQCTLEPRATPTGKLALRLGLRYVRGLARQAAARIAAEARRRPFGSAAEVAYRCGCDTGALARLAAAGALDGLALHRRSAQWEAVGTARLHRSRRATPRQERLPLGFTPLRQPAPVPPLERFLAARQATETGGDGHPFALLRPLLRTHGLISAAILRTLPHGAQVRCAGWPTCVQRPATAKGVVFLTLEDETGLANLILWPRVAARFWHLLRARIPLVATGRSERQAEVAHLIVEHLAPLHTVLGAELPAFPAPPPRAFR